MQNKLSDEKINDCRRIPTIHTSLVAEFWDKYVYKLLTQHGGAPECDWSHPSFSIINTIHICNKHGCDIIHITPYSIGIYDDIKVTTKDLNKIRRICIDNGVHEFYWTVI